MKKCFNQLFLSHGSQGGQLMLNCTLKDVTLAILMEYEHGVIIKFLFNKGVDVRQISERLRAQFHEHADTLRVIQFWITELRQGQEDIHNEPRTGKTLNRKSSNQNPRTIR
jgi:hypothetical protein